MLSRTRSCHYENFVFAIGQCPFKDTLIKSVLTKKKNKQVTTENRTRACKLNPPHHLYTTKATQQ